MPFKPGKENIGENIKEGMKSSKTTGKFGNTKTDKMSDKKVRNMVIAASLNSYAKKKRKK